MPAGDEPSHPMRPCASLSMKSPLGIAGRISKRKHRKTPAGEDCISSSVGAALSFVLRDISVFFGADPFCGLFLCRVPGTGIFVPVSVASAFAFSDGIPSFGLLSAPSEGPMNRRGLFLFSAFLLFLLCFSALPLSAFRFSPICQRLRGSGENGGEWQGMGCGKRGEWPLPFSRSQTIPHKLRYPSALCAAYLSISV